MITSLFFSFPPFYASGAIQFGCNLYDGLHIPTDARDDPFAVIFRSRWLFFLFLLSSCLMLPVRLFSFGIHEGTNRVWNSGFDNSGKWKKGMVWCTLILTEKSFSLPVNYNFSSSSRFLSLAGRIFYRNLQFAGWAHSSIQTSLSRKRRYQHLSRRGEPCS